MKKAAFARFASLAAIGFLPVNICTAQQPSAKPLRFEAAAVKPGHLPSDPGQGESFTKGGGSGGQYRIVNMPLKQWVEMGLSVQDYALKAPAWLDTSKFDLDARLPLYDPSNHNAVAEMMKALLIERFGMQWHEELGTVSGYELVTDKKTNLQPAGVLERLRGPAWGSGPTIINGTNLSMVKLAEMLGTALGKPVVDATHLSGGYDLKLQWRPDSDAQAAEQKRYGTDVDNLPGSVFTAVKEQLGLRLQPAKVPSKVIVIDHINNQPTPN